MYLYKYIFNYMHLYLNIIYIYIYYILCIYFIFYIYCINTYFVYKHCKWLYILNSFIKRLVLHLHNVTNICSHINIKTTIHTTNRLQLPQHKQVRKMKLTYKYIILHRHTRLHLYS